MRLVKLLKILGEIKLVFKLKKNFCPYKKKKQKSCTKVFFILIEYVLATNLRSVKSK